MLLCMCSSLFLPFNILILAVCPCCGNLLTIAATPADQLPLNEREDAGKNRFQCRTCPYQMMITGRYYERKNMKTKEVEDVLGGADSWKNVDKTQGTSGRQMNWY